MPIVLGTRLVIGLRGLALLWKCLGVWVLTRALLKLVVLLVATAGRRFMASNRLIGAIRVLFLVRGCFRVA